MAATDDVRLRFDHVSIAVKSIDRAYEFFAKYFPIKLRGAKTIDEQVSGSFYWQDFHFGGFVVERFVFPKNSEITLLLALDSKASLLWFPAFFVHPDQAVLLTPRRCVGKLLKVENRNCVRANH